MVRRLGMLVLLASTAFAAGCSVASKGLGAVGGCDPCHASIGSQTRTYARTWSRDLQRQQEFIDTYFFNYDVNDPYRCDCPIYDYCPTCP